MLPTCPSSSGSYRLVAVCSAYSTPDLTVFEAGVAGQHITPSFDAIRVGDPRVLFVRRSAGRSRSFGAAEADGELSAKDASASERIRESRQREESVDDGLSACPAMVG